MLMNSGKLMDGKTRGKKKIGIKEEHLTFYANCFFLDVMLCYM